ncbi:MAG: hypothetical protein H0V48_04450 [Nocardioidaceae bacterium]|nr:hypothetical protein [Nocardioidaceae bacterium]
MTSVRPAATPTANDAPDRLRRGPGPGTAVVVMGWISLVLVLDSDGGLWLQRGLGALTWCLLVGVLVRESALVRTQTLVVIAFATAVEYACSPLLEVYTYRFDNVPAYVPPGHGLVYLAALAVGRSAWVRGHLRGCTAAVLVVGGAYALWGLTWAARPDVLGAFWFGCLVGFLLWGPSRPLYVGAFVVVTYLELMGTGLGTWTWQPYDPTGLVAMGNPPSGAAGGYGWFDLAALAAAPALLTRWRRLRQVLLEPRRR